MIFSIPIPHDEGTQLDNYLCRISKLLYDLWDERSILGELVSRINEYEEKDSDSDDSFNCGNITKCDLDNIEGVILELQIIQQELKENQLYKSVDLELTELENNPGIIYNDLSKYVDYNEIEKMQEICKRFLRLSKGHEIEKYLNNTSLEGLQLLSNEDKATLHLFYKIVLKEKIQLFKSCFEDFKNLNVKLEVVYLEFETILDNLKAIKNKQII